MKEFSKANLQIVRARMNAVLAEVGIEGVTFEIGNMRFSPTEVTIKVTAKTSGAQDNLVTDAKNFGIASIEKDGWKIVDFQMSRRKYPWIAEHAGKRFKMSSNQARKQFGATAGAHLD